jgi:type IV pilus assembly protein PilA
MKSLKKQFTLSKSKGFTLIELLIVVAVIAILATVVITNVAGARQKANDSSTLATLSETAKSMAQCAADDGTVNVAYTLANLNNTIPTGETGGRLAMPICTGGGGSVSMDYPILGKKGSSGTIWTYTAVPTYASTTGVLSLTANSGANSITCTQNGCTKVGF